MTTHLPFFVDSSLMTTKILCAFFFQDDDDDFMFFLWIHPVPQSDRSLLSIQLRHGGDDDDNDDNHGDDDDDSKNPLLWNTAVMPIGFDMRRRAFAL